ncbi:hypothetical protein QFZ76_009114 [Streptomyces sp. V4I2]|nr:hypothetical protein [Streptomyces sp. V4I2]
MALDAASPVKEVVAEPDHRIVGAAATLLEAGEDYTAPEY